MIAIVTAFGVWLIMMGFWFAGMPSWVVNDVNIGALAAAAIVFVLMKIRKLQ